MDSETVHGTARSGVTSVPEAGPLFWRSVDAGWKRQKHGDGLQVLRPGQTGSSLLKKGLHTATGAAGEGCNEKSSLHYSRDSEG
ncbi:Transposase [Escherichia coli]